MIRIRSQFAFMLVVLAVLASCTSPRWTVKNEQAVDKSDYVVLDRTRYLGQVGEVTPQNPVLRLQLLSHTTYEYAEKVLLQRNIQEFKLRPGFVALGLLGAGLAIYMANSSAIGGTKTPTQQVTLNVVGGIIGLSGLLNMKPVGDPRPTGEERFLRRTGSHVETDTVQVMPNETDTARVTVTYNKRTLVDDALRSFDSEVLELSLGSFMGDLEIEGENPGDVRVRLQYRDSTYQYQFPVETVLLPYARVTSPVTELRNQPADTAGSVLAELAEGSQLQIVGREGEAWYRVLYGISENFIRRADAQLVWRSSEFARENKVIAMPQVPFGNIDVENNIPILSGIKQESAALIITNENYSGDLRGRTYASRDGKLIRTYLENALGYPEENIITLDGIRSKQAVDDALEHLGTIAGDSTELFVFLSGYGSIRGNSGSISFDFLGIDADLDSLAGPPLVNLSELFLELGSLPSRKTIVLSDINFSEATPDSLFRDNQLLLDQAFRNITSLVTDKKENSVVITGSEINQISYAYVSGSTGEDKKHRIFPYFFAKALQQRMTNIGEISQYLERNISYTSRKLHDHAQDPQIFGSLSLNLAN